MLLYNGTVFDGHTPSLHTPYHIPSSNSNVGLSTNDGSPMRTTPRDRLPLTTSSSVGVSSITTCPSISSARSNCSQQGSSTGHHYQSGGAIALPTLATRNIQRNMTGSSPGGPSVSPSASSSIPIMHNIDIMTLGRSSQPSSSSVQQQINNNNVNNNFTSSSVPTLPSMISPRGGYARVPDEKM